MGEFETKKNDHEVALVLANWCVLHFCPIGFHVVSVLVVTTRKGLEFSCKFLPLAAKVLWKYFYFLTFEI